MVDVGGIINRLAPLFEKTVKAEYQLLVNSKNEAKNLSSSLMEIQTLMEEAERRRLADPRVRNWLVRLQDVMHEIDDALDKWNTESMRLQIQEYDDKDEDENEDASRTWWKMIGEVAHSFCSSFKHFRRNRAISLTIKELNGRVDLIAKETAKYTLFPIDYAEYAEEVGHDISTSYSEILPLPSQESQKTMLVRKLVSNEGGDFQVTTLFGMVGIGKTTLAQLVFRDPEVQGSFALKSWISVPYKFDNVYIVKAILQSLNQSHPEDAVLQTLLDHVKSFISDKKFLLVLDNAWQEKNNIWGQLKACLEYGAPGSRIMVTTRNKAVANLMGGITKVELLPHSDCLLLLTQVALQGRETAEDKQLERIGGDIASRCAGLPLAAKTLGDYLSSKYSKELWDDAWNKEFWQIEEVAKSLFAPLAFTYSQWRLELKHCFLTCVLFPKGTTFEISEFIRVWMVQGYVSSSREDAEMKLKGFKYIEKLFMESFFQDPEIHSKGDNLTWKMHGLLHDFAQYLVNSGSEGRRRRSLYTGQEVLPNQLARSGSVRILIGKFGEEPTLEMGDLIHLRYLNVSRSPCKNLPNTICNLYNLQILDLQFCKQLSRLPNGIHRLRNLRHLLLLGATSLEGLPKGIAKLTRLQTLDHFTVGRGVVTKLEYFRNLNQLEGYMRIYVDELKDEGDVEDAREADFRSKIHIKEWKLVFRGEVRLDVMEALHAPPNLLSLGILHYRGSHFPKWIGNKYLDKLKQLSFFTCDSCLCLPPLGALPSLISLEIYRLPSIKRIGVEFLGTEKEAFPKLQQLTFESCHSLEEWEDINEAGLGKSSIMPCLQHLRIEDCRILKSLPSFLLYEREPRQQLLVRNSPLLSNQIQHYEERERQLFC